MNHLEMLSIEAAVAFSNEVAKEHSRNAYPSYKIVWKSSLGLATGNVIHYDKSNYPIIKETHDSLDFWNETYTPEKSEDLFAVIRHKVIPYFIDSSGFGLKNMSLMSKPDVLLEELLHLSKIETTDGLKVPNYSSILNFQTLDKSIDLPFITFEAARIECVATLISES
ncbi:hypothetical protein [Pediococcus acidilactici]|uniref:hypothetical protein n=1 Tax=Pediococcus acidilactici TaxID=1254 RepID=UPI003B428ECA